MKETKFKQTDIGLIPEDWVVKEIEKVAPLQRGFDLPQKKLVNGVFPVVYSNGICNYHHKYLIKGPGVVTGRSGTIGKIHYIENNYWPHNTTLWVTNFYNNNPLFIYYLFKSFDWLRFSTGTGVPTLNRNFVHEEKVALPPTIEEQERIANALSQVDDLLAALDEQIEKKKLIKQGTMQQLLTGKTRLKGFSGKWMTVKLGDVADIRTGKRNGDENIESGLYPFFVRSQSVYRINSYSYDGEAILIPGEGGIGKIFHYINGKFDYHQRVYKISDFPSNFDTKFVYFYLMKFFGSHALQNTVKATVDSLRLPTFQDFMLVVPPTLAEQQTIASILSTMDDEIQALQEERDKYALVKQGMMQQLLTGKIRLN